MDPEARSIVVKRAKREREIFRKRLRTILKKVEGLHSYSMRGGGVPRRSQECKVLRIFLESRKQKLAAAFERHCQSRHSLHYQSWALTDRQMLTYPLPEIHHPTKPCSAQGEWKEAIDEDSSTDC
jgi:hypothetical protein